MKRFTSFTDESGIIKKRKFIIATAIINNSICEEFKELLEKIEEESGKKKKWADVGVMTRTRYTKLLLKKGIFDLCTVYYEVSKSITDDYIILVSAHVDKAISTYANGETYVATIFIDRINKRMTQKLSKAIHQRGVRYKKIRGLDDDNNVGLKFIDAMCGLIRDINNANIDSSYKTIFKKLKQI